PPAPGLGGLPRSVPERALRRPHRPPPTRGPSTPRATIRCCCSPPPPRGAARRCARPASSTRSCPSTSTRTRSSRGPARRPPPPRTRRTPSPPPTRCCCSRGRRPWPRPAPGLVDDRAPADGGTGATFGATASGELRFADLTDEEIEAYVATGEPLGVAGGFTIDGRGGPFVEHLEGDPHAVVGLSLPLLRRMLGEIAVGVHELWEDAPGTGPSDPADG